MQKKTLHKKISLNTPTKAKFPTSALSASFTNISRQVNNHVYNLKTLLILAILNPFLIINLAFSELKLIAGLV